MVDLAAGRKRAGGVRDDTAPMRRSRPPDSPLLTDADERWRMLEETTQEGVWMIDADNRVTYANQVLGDMLGYPIEELLGIDLFDLMDEEAQLMAHATLEQRRKGIDENLEFRCRHRNGADVWVSVRAAQTLTENGEFLGTLATVVDISALRAARRDLELAQTISLAIGAADDFRGALREVLSGIARVGGGWDYAEAWLPNPLDGTMSLEATWSKAQSANPDADAAAGRRFPSLPGAQFAKRVCDAGEPNRVDHFDEQADEQADEHGAAAEEVAGRACRSTLGVPVKAAHEVVAVLLLFATSQSAPDERPQRRMETLASHLGVELDRRRSEDTRVDSERRFHEFIDHMPAMVYMKSVDGRLLLHNRKAAELWSLNDDSGSDADTPLHATEASRANDASVAASEDAHTFLETAELADGTHWYSSVKFPVFDSSGDVYGVGAITRDITDRKKVDEELSEAYRQLERRALHDSLTGLPNRAQLLERLASLDRNRLLATALLFVDLDDFKDVNDTYGHAEGDELLRMAAARMRNCIRPGDVLARLGGDEFAVLLEGADVVAAESLARRIVDVMNTPFAVGGQESRVTASVGIAVGTIADTKPEVLLRYADMAMYEAKSKGKGRFATFDTALSEALTLRTRTESELRDAIQNGALELYYQPIVDLASGEMVGAEALVRWRHPIRGLLAPDEFVPLAERTGLVVPLGAWVLRDACRQAAIWQAARPEGARLVISVNVSARQLDDPVFVSTVSDALQSTGLDPKSLCLEITETAVMANPSGAQQAVQPLQDLGVELAIDDFGTGYASLTYLRRLRAGAVKIDRSFVDGLGRELEDTTIVSAVIGLAHAMGLSVTAEGIETTEQLLILRDMGCQNAQGFLMCPPIPAAELTKQLERHWLDGPIVERTSPLESARPIRVVVADNDDDNRSHLRGALEATGQFEVVGEAIDGDGAVHLAASHRPHLVLLDQKLTKLEGLAALPIIRLAAPDALVVVLADRRSPESVDRAIALGAAGCYEKGADLASELLTLARRT